MRPLLLAPLALAIAVLPGCDAAPQQAATSSGKAAIGGPFQLVDQNGRPVTEASLRGKPSLVFFGYTFCPEVCPTTLANMSRWLNNLGPGGDKLNVFYVTVDPQRDTSAQLKQYLSAFDPRIRGLTGTPAAVAQTAKEYGVYYQRHPLPNGDYEMDHSTAIYVMDRDGRYQQIIAYSDPDSVAMPILRKAVAS